MGNKNNTSQNILYSIVYQIVVAIVPIITAPYLSRCLSTSGIGIVSYYSSIVGYFVLFTKLGTQTFGTRQISIHKNDKNKLNIYFTLLVIISGIVGLLCLMAYAFFVFYQPAQYKIICVIFSFQIIAAILDVSWLFFGLEEFKITSLRNIVVKIATTLCVFLFVKDNEDMWIYILIISLGTLVSSSTLWFGVCKRVQFIKVSIHEVFDIFKGCIILFIPTIATTIYKNMDKIILGSIYSMDSVGLYTNAEKIPDLLLCFIGAIGTVMMPKMCKNINNVDSNSNELIHKIMTYVMIVSIGISFGLAGISLVFTPIFFGIEFYEAGKLMILFSVSIIFTSWSSIIRNLYILPHKRDLLIIKTVCIGVILNLFIDVIFIPTYGGYGAVLGLLIAEISIPITQFFYLKNELGSLYITMIKSILPFFCFGIVEFICTFGLKYYIYNSYICLLCQILIGGIIYIIFCAIYILKTKNYIYNDILDMLKRRVYK